MKKEIKFNKGIKLSNIITLDNYENTKKKIQLNTIESKSTNSYQLTLSQRHTKTSSEINDNYSSRSSRKINYENKPNFPSYQLLELVQNQREKKILSPLKEGKIKKKLLCLSCEDLKKKIRKISYDLNNVINSEFNLNTSSKKKKTLKIVESNLGKNYRKKIWELKNENNELRNKINYLDHETYNSIELYNKIKNEVENMKNNHDDKSDDVNKLIETKKALEKKLIIYQTKNKKLNEIVYNQVKIDNRIQSEFKKMILNMK